MTSPASVSSSKDTLAVESEQENVRKLISSIEAKACPFALKWSYGFNSRVPLVNLTTNNRAAIGYSCSHAAMIYNYYANEVLPLQGHQNAIRTMSATNDGKWILTADFEDDCVIVIWNTENGVPICSIFNPHGRNCITAVKISPDGRYVISVGNENYQRVNFWLWTHGKEQPDATVELKSIPSERVKEINFNAESTDEFVLTTESSVIFFFWNDGELQHYYSATKKSSRVFNCSCFISKTSQVLTATDDGYVLVWDYKDATSVNKFSDRRIFIKSIRLQKCNITVIINYESMVVTGNSCGDIKFYDKDLRLLCWCNNCNLDSIVTISFDLTNTCGSSHFKTSITKNIKPGLRICIKDKNSANCDFFPVNATIQGDPFVIKNFIVSTLNGLVAYMDMKKLKCYFIWSDPIAAVSSLDAHPENDIIVTGNINGILSLYNCTEYKLIISRSVPTLLDFKKILENEVLDKKINYATCPVSHESLKAVTALKYSPAGELLACGLENGTLWMIHPITLEPSSRLAYKHSRTSIIHIAFDKNFKYMAYADDEMTTAVFKRDSNYLNNEDMWCFLGKYRAHAKPIKGILFGDPMSGTNDTCRFFSLGEDQDLVEYDLKNSGHFPEPGLKILQVERIEHNCIPLCLGWYPQFGSETFLVFSNSQFKFRLINDLTKMIRGTFLGPTFGAPVHHFLILPQEDPLKAYMVFATNKEIGLQLLPLDGNPHKILGMIGHSKKIIKIAVAANGKTIFAIGYNDPCVLVWKINLKSVDVSADLGGKGLIPYCSLIEGGGSGWLMKEMKDFFYFAQILHEGEHTITTRNISDKISTKQIPNLMRAIGFYATNQELEDIISEVSYQTYAETGQLVEEITFEEFVRLYINHRPAFGFSLKDLKKVFQNLVPSVTFQKSDLILRKQQFLNILFGRGPEDTRKDGELYGEPLNSEEAHQFLKLLIPEKKDGESDEENRDDLSFDFVPPVNLFAKS